MGWACLGGRGGSCDGTAAGCLFDERDDGVGGGWMRACMRASALVWGFFLFAGAVGYTTARTAPPYEVGDVCGLFLFFILWGVREGEGKGRGVLRSWRGDSCNK